MKKILIIGPINNAHIIRLLKHIKKYDYEQKLRFDGFNTDITSNGINQYLDNCYCIKKHFGTCLYIIPIIKTICLYLDIIISYLRIRGHYDICNIHFPTAISACLFFFLKSKAKQIIISPWGSDVYRIKKKKHYWMVKLLYRIADTVTVPPIKFREDIQKIFNIPNSKIVNLGFGSEIIDILIQLNYNQIDAKSALGFKDKFIITCGYNANPAQNHLHIIKSLIQIKELLPPNTLLILPMTYVRDDTDYINKVKSELINSGIQFVIYENYLENLQTAYIRIATDIFIHIQKTDAYSATVQEFLLTDTVVFNGCWIRYPNLEAYGIPYYLVDKKIDLEKCLTTYFLNGTNHIIPEKCKEIIKQLSWDSKGKEWFNYLIRNE